MNRKNQSLSIVLSLFLVFLSCGQDTEKKGNHDIVGMVHLFGKKKYNTFSGTWKFGQETTWLLFKNGWALKNPDTPPENINPEKSREEHPEQWEQWKGKEKFEKATLYKPSKKGARYSMNVALRTVGGAPGQSSVSTKRLKLMEDGRFETSIFSLAGIEGGGSSTTIGVSNDKRGTKGTVSGKTSTGTGTVSTTGKNSKGPEGNMSGTYFISGHSIELHFDNGTTVSHIFATNGKDDMILGTKFYFQ